MKTTIPTKTEVLSRIQQHQEQLKAFGVKHLGLFGSFVREEQDAESDVDVLVEFEAGHTPGFRLISMQDELSQLFGGRRIDLVTPKFLNKRIRDKVLAEALVQYAS